jgi:hypothetical protein
VSAKIVDGWCFESSSSWLGSKYSRSSDVLEWVAEVLDRAVDKELDEVEVVAEVDCWTLEGGLSGFLEAT